MIENKIEKICKFIFILAYKVNQMIIRDIYRIRYPFISKKLNRVNVLTINDSIDKLIHNNKSLSRFGDGEISWALGGNKYGSFEKSSHLLRKRLLQVLKSNQSNLAIALPDALNGLDTFTKESADFWKGILSRYLNRLYKCINLNKTYYNTSISRCYMDYNNKNKRYGHFKHTFNHLKKIWSNKNILIVEGEYSRLGATSDLFSNTKCIKRIECPPIDAFEHYNQILSTSKSFLNNHENFLTILSLGPTATILAYDLSKYGYRTIDIGHVDLEYEWFLKGAHEKINIPTKYINSYRIKGSHHVSKLNNSEYKKEIYCHIK